MNTEVKPGEVTLRINTDEGDISITLKGVEERLAMADRLLIAVKELLDMDITKEKQ